MKRRCAVSGVEFEIKEDEAAFYVTMGVPTPKLCPEERNRLRMSFRNFFQLYQRPCSATGKRVISQYHENQPFPVYDNSYWWSDAWSAYDYGRELDLNRPFLDQYAELARAVPRFALINLNNENCDFCNACFFSKNCYLVFGCVRNEDCLYGHIIWDSKSCVDSVYLYRCEWCSNSRDLVDCYDVHYSSECMSCQESAFLHDCQGCSNCFGCFNLRKKQYCFFNEQLSRDEYLRRTDALYPLTVERIERIQQSFETMLEEQAIFPESFSRVAEDCSGDHIYECASAHNSFDVKRCERIWNCFTAHALDNCADISFTGNTARFAYNSLTMVEAERVICSHVIQSSYDIAYSEFCRGSHDLIGCNGLRNAEYCILNRQYSKDDYTALRDQIIDGMKQRGEWGEFFPAHLSPFAYNESIAGDYAPLSQAEAAHRGLRWREPRPIARSNEATNASPQQQFLSCAATGRQFKLIPAEIHFAERMRLPLPRLCPDERRRRLLARRPFRCLTYRQCALCKTPLETDQPANRSVLCETCYLEKLHS
ncbi:MAG: hypothetical protein U0136_08545 [Bdellovibrionota bacterium]